MPGRAGAMAVTPRLARPPLPPAAFADPQRRARLRQALPAVEEMLRAHVSENDIRALAAGVVLDGELVFAKGWGQTRAGGQAVGADTVFRIGSVTKVVTAMAILALVADGKLQLDDPAATHLPELAGLAYPSLDAGVITVRQLLTHTSGLPRSHDLPGLGEHPSADDVLAALDGLMLTTAPGDNRRYSNLGGGLLGLLVARVSGMPFRDFVRRRVLDRLDIADMAWDAGDVPLGRLAAPRDPGGRELSTAEHERIGPLEGAGGLYGSTEALAKIVAAQLDAWPPRSDPETGPIPRELLRESQRMHVFEGLHVRSGDPVRGVAEGTGLIWQVRQTCAFEHLVWHNGSIDGYRSAVFFLPRRGVAVILLASAGGDLSPLASLVLSKLVTDGQLPRRKTQPSRALSDALDEVARMYRLGNLNEPTYQRVFSASFREQISLQEVRHVLSTSRSRRGPCTRDRILESPNPHEARFSLTCERGTVRLHMRMTTQAPHEIKVLRDDPSTDADRDATDRCR